MRELLAKRGLPTDEDHAGIHDTSALLAFEATPGQWVRKDKLSLADAKTGVQGHPQFATPELGKIYNDMKVDLARKHYRMKERNPRHKDREDDMTLKLVKLAGASTFALALTTLPSVGAEEPL